ncbi:MAG: GGDEF domain-containing protein [Clostridiales bacterium]|nr:GGDEF domain-containing protein [Clostridiales bacterium]
MNKRSQSNAQQLFIQILNSLGAQESPHDTIPDILQATCLFFRFGCGFIYETNYANTFELRELCGYYKENKLPASLDIFSILTAKQVREFIAMGTIVIKPGEHSSGLCTKLYGLFSCQLLVLAPIINNKGELIGLVGMSDRRAKIALSAADFALALSVLRMTGNQIKLHIYQKWLENTRNAMTSILDNTAVDIYVTDLATDDIIYANSSMAKAYGGQDIILSKKCWQIQGGNRKGPCTDCKQHEFLDKKGVPVPGLICSRDFLRPQDNSWQRVTSACFRWVDGRLANVISSMDITENKHNEELIRHLAEYDDLTDLPNRRRLLQDINKLFSGKKCEGYVLFFDLDGFKRVNDGLGHQAGDELLRQVGQVLQKGSLTGGHCYRHSGDEFVLIYKDISRRRLFEIINFLLERFAEPWHLRDGMVRCGCSLGIAHYPSDGGKALELLHGADLAMYASKKQSHNKVHFYEQGHITMVEDLYMGKE